MRASAILLVLALTLTGCAHRPGLGTTADAATTWAVLEQGGAELNPLLAWAPTPAATVLAGVVIKHGAKVALSSSGLTSERTAHRAVEAGGMAGAGWNLAALLGGTGIVPIIGGLGAGLWYWWWGG